MGLLKRCMELINNFVNNDSEGNYLCEVDRFENSTIPSIVLSKYGEMISSLNHSIYYVSDIHLDEHIVYEFGADISDEKVVEYIKKIISGMFCGEFLYDVLNQNHIIILFGGDISSSFDISKIFYGEFVKQWERIEIKNYKEKLNTYNTLIPEIKALSEKIAENEVLLLKWKSSNAWVEKIMKPLLEQKRVPKYIKKIIAEIQELSLELSSYKKIYFDAEEYKNRIKRSHESIFAILGNHEFWDFSNENDCRASYSNLFSSIGIKFLDNKAVWLEYNEPYVRKEENEREYKRLLNHMHCTVILGGTGFAGNNSKFNADSGLYRTAINRSQEIKETQKWLKLYHDTVLFTQKTKSNLIVLTHNPLSDWSNNPNGEIGCTYFNGHNHRNYFFRDEDANTYVFANNQVGYKNNDIKFKKALVYRNENPFAGYEDGCHEINSAQYVRFYDYIVDSIYGNGQVELQMSTKQAKFYMIKYNGYYGFFLTSSAGTYICQGGKIKKIKKYADIEDVCTLFPKMVDKYIEALAPYIEYQKQISEFVKSFGGYGKIHGCIVDIDFLNHIMLNPQDGAVTFYHSPMFGVIKPYDNLVELLDMHSPELAGKYRERLESNEFNKLSVSKETHLDGEFIKISIKDSLYSLSRKIKQLQRLFDSKVLRDWNADLLTDNTLSNKELL